MKLIRIAFERHIDQAGTDSAGVRRISTGLDFALPHCVHRGLRDAIANVAIVQAIDEIIDSVGAPAINCGNRLLLVAIPSGKSTTLGVR